MNKHEKENRIRWQVQKKSDRIMTENPTRRRTPTFASVISRKLSRIDITPFSVSWPTNALQLHSLVAFYNNLAPQFQRLVKWRNYGAGLLNCRGRLLSRIAKPLHTKFPKNTVHYLEEQHNLENHTHLLVILEWVRKTTFGVVNVPKEQRRYANIGPRVMKWLDNISNGTPSFMIK